MTPAPHSLRSSRYASDNNDINYASTPKIQYESELPEQNIMKGLEPTMNLNLDGISEEDEEDK
jgi:hypothetical protein